MNNSRGIGGLDPGYRSDGREGRGNQCTDQICHWRLNARVAVGTIGRIGSRLVVMEQAAQQPHNEERNNGKSFDGELSPCAPFWMRDPHVRRGPSTNFANYEVSGREQGLFTKIL